MILPVSTMVKTLSNRFTVCRKQDLESFFLTNFKNKRSFLFRIYKTNVFQNSNISAILVLGWDRVSSKLTFD